MAKIKDLSDLFGPNTTVVALWSTCAPGTSKVLYHKKCSHICSPHEQSFLCRSTDQHKQCLKSPLSPGVQSSLGWVVFLLIYPEKLFCSCYSPWEWNRLSYHSPWHPMMLSWQSPLLIHSYKGQSLWWKHGPSEVGLSATVEMSHI